MIRAPPSTQLASSRSCAVLVPFIRERSSSRACSIRSRAETLSWESPAISAAARIGREAPTGPWPSSTARSASRWSLSPSSAVARSQPISNRPTAQARAPSGSGRASSAPASSTSSLASSSLSSYPPGRVAGAPVARRRHWPSPAGAKAWGPSPTPPSLKSRITLISSRSCRIASAGPSGPPPWSASARNCGSQAARPIPSLRIASIGASTVSARTIRTPWGSCSRAGDIRSPTIGAIRRSASCRLRASASSAARAWSSRSRSSENSVQPSQREAIKSVSILAARSPGSAETVSPRASR